MWYLSARSSVAEPALAVRRCHQQLEQPSPGGEQEEGAQLLSRGSLRAGWLRAVLEHHAPSLAATSLQQGPTGSFPLGRRVGDITVW